MRYFIGLGSNQGDRKRALNNALHRMEISGLVLKKKSSIYQTEPVGPVRQNWFLNQVVCSESRIEALEMIRLLRSIEISLGRLHTEPMGPRPIDLDILLAGQTIMNSEELTIPHPEMHKRRFVLVPLAEIDPFLCHPVLKLTMKKLLQLCEDTSEVGLFENGEMNFDL